MRQRAFTLIELLLVVLIITVLVAIAVPNFLAAQIRTKIGRAHADMHSLAMALESYRADYTHYPLSVSLQTRRLLSHADRLQALTSPVSYLSAVPHDIFRPGTPYSYLERHGYERTNRYAGQPDVNGVIIIFFNRYHWVLASVGPAGGRPDMSDGYGWEDSYDPTNGTMSVGSPLRVGP